MKDTKWVNKPLLAARDGRAKSTVVIHTNRNSIKICRLHLTILIDRKTLNVTISGGRNVISVAREVTRSIKSCANRKMHKVTNVDRTSFNL